MEEKVGSGSWPLASKGALWRGEVLDQWGSSGRVLDQNIISILPDAPVENFVLDKREDSVAQPVVPMRDRWFFLNCPILALDTLVHRLWMGAREASQMF